MWSQPFWKIAYDLKEHIHNNKYPMLFMENISKFVNSNVYDEGLAPTLRQIDGLAQDCSNSIANVQELLQYYSKLSICKYIDDPYTVNSLI